MVTVASLSRFLIFLKLRQSLAQAREKAQPLGALGLGGGDVGSRGPARRARRKRAEPASCGGFGRGAPRTDVSGPGSAQPGGGKGRGGGTTGRARRGRGEGGPGTRGGERRAGEERGGWSERRRKEGGERRALAPKWEKGASERGGGAGRGAGSEEPSGPGWGACSRRAWQAPRGDRAGGRESNAQPARVS